jgi:hypothetical protein
MTKSAQQSGEDQVNAFIQKLDHPLKDTVDKLRQIILQTDKTIGEQVKWNSPAFWYTGKMKPFDPKEYKRDIVVFNLHKKEYILLVFPTGATINDTTGLLEGNYTDGRRVMKITGKKDAEVKAEGLKRLIKAWLNFVDR